MTRIYDATVSARVLGPFAVNAGWSQTQQNVDRDSRRLRDRDSGRPGRRFERRVNTCGGGATFAQCGRHPDRRLPPRRRGPADLPDGLHRPGPLRVPGRVELQGLPQGRRPSSARPTPTTTSSRSATTRRSGSSRATSRSRCFKNMLTLHGGRRRVPDEPPDPHPGAPGLRRSSRPSSRSSATTGRAELHFQSGTISRSTRAYLWMNNNGSIPFTVSRVRALAEYFFTNNLGADFEWHQDKYDGARRLRPGRTARELQRQSLLRRPPLAP